MRDSGWVIMKMISSTSSTSIIGVTLMSDWTPPEFPALIAMSLLLLLVLVGLEQPGVPGLGDGRHHPHAGAARRLDGLLDPGILELVVGLEVQDLVLGARGIDRAELILQRAVGQRAAVQEVPAGLVDAQHHLVVP